MTTITIEVAAYMAAAAAILASTDAGKVSRLGVEAVRTKLGISPLAVYAPKAFVAESRETDAAARDDGGPDE